MDTRTPGGLVDSRLGGIGDGLFARKATGLVREIGLLDIFLLNVVGLNVGVGSLLMLNQAPAFFPGGSMAIAVVIGTLVMAFTIWWAYSEFAACMPRSGGDYVFVSRGLHPFLGWLLNWNQVIWLMFFWIAFNPWFVATAAAPATLSILTAVTGNSAFENIATTISQPIWVGIIGSVLNGLFVVLIIRRQWWGWQRTTVALAFLALVIVALLVLFRGSDMPAAWNAFAQSHHGLSYGQIEPAAVKAGYPAHVGGFDFAATLLMLPWVFFVVGYSTTPTILGGEVKNASRNMYIATAGAVLVNGLVMLLVVLSVSGVLGQNWLGALGTLPNSKLGVPITPQANFLASLLTNNLFLLVLIGFGFVCWALNGSGPSMLTASRYLLAASLDRMVPQWMGEVDDRWHAPVKALLMCWVCAEIGLIFLITVPQASLLGALLSQIGSLVLVGIAAITFPSKLPNVWKSGSGRTIGGIPTIRLAGIGAVIVLGGMIVIFVVNPTINSAFLVTSRLSLIAMSSVLVAGAIWYVVAYFLNRSRGYDIALTYKEVPPE